MQNVRPGISHGTGEVIDINSGISNPIIESEVRINNIIGTFTIYYTVFYFDSNDVDIIEEENVFGMNNDYHKRKKFTTDDYDITSVSYMFGATITVDNGRCESWEIQMKSFY